MNSGPEVSEKGRHGHYGLPGMQERVRQIRGKLEIWSKLGAGTGIELSSPGRSHAAHPEKDALSSFQKKVGRSVIRILSVDDHPMLREGVAALIGKQADMQLVAEAADGREALELFRTHRPDITLMDLQMPEMTGIDVIGAIRAEFPGARIVVLTTHAGDVQISRALKAGARAYLLKGLLRKELLETIRAVHAGQRSVSAEVAAEIAEHASDDALTPREVDVLCRVAGGNANKEIAAQLFLTEETVKSHIKNILVKLAANDRTHAVAIGLKRGIIGL